MSGMVQKTVNNILILPIRFYQYAISPLTPAACRHVPSCSEYSVQALNMHGPRKGGWLALKRIGRCHPWGTSGFDPVPKFLIKKINLKKYSLSSSKIPKHDLLKPMLLLIIAIFGGLLISSCNSKGTEKTDVDRKIKVLVSISPQKYFVEKIGGNRVDVDVLIPSGTNPHLYDPTPGQLIGITKTAIYFYNGYLDFEKYWIDNILESNQQIISVKVSRGVQLLRDVEHSGHNHEGNDHGVDPHIWLSVKNARIIATNVYNGLKENFPGYSDYFDANYKTLLGEIDSLEKEITTKLSSVENRKFMIFHPTLSYYANEFGLEQIAIEFEGKEPTPKHLKATIDRARKAGIHTIFIQKEFDISNAGIISEELGGALVQIDPLSEDWYKNMLFITDNIANASIK
jgi:zinc transport system substrate-binding protein